MEAELKYAGLPDHTGASLPAVFTLDPSVAEVSVGREGLARVLLCLQFPRGFR